MRQSRYKWITCVLPSPNTHLLSRKHNCSRHAKMQRCEYASYQIHTQSRATLPLVRHQQAWAAVADPPP